MKALWPFRPPQADDATAAEGAAAGRASAPQAAVHDPLLEQRLRQVLVESRRRYKDLVEVSSDFAWETRADGSFAFVSPRGALGYGAAELVDRPSRDFLVEGAMPEASPFEARAPVEEIEFGFRRADGSVAMLHAAALPLHDEAGAWQGARGVCRDVTELLARDAALARAHRRERLFAEIVTAIRDVVEPANMLGAAAEATARALKAAGCRIFRFAPERGFALAAAARAATLPGSLDASLAAALEGPEGEVIEADGLLLTLARYRHEVNGALCLWRGGDDEWRWDEEARALALAVANQLGIAIEQIANHEALERLSHTDPLTGLLNRRGFFDQLGRRLARLGREGRAAALVYVDLDNFKPINDRFGHRRGDELLAHAAQLLRRGTRPADLIGRLGGDEFALWLEGVDGRGAHDRAGLLVALADELKGFSAAPGRPLGFSVGVALFDPTASETLDALTARADAAMYAIKHGGKGGFHVAPAPLVRESAP